MSPCLTSVGDGDIQHSLAIICYFAPQNYKEFLEYANKNGFLIKIAYLFLCR